jgi:hypothetical protein
MELVRALGDGTRMPTVERSERLRKLLERVEKTWGDPGWRPELDRAGFLEELREAVVTATR